MDGWNKMSFHPIDDDDPVYHTVSFPKHRAAHRPHRPHLHRPISCSKTPSGPRPPLASAFDPGPCAISSYPAVWHNKLLWSGGGDPPAAASQKYDVSFQPPRVIRVFSRFLPAIPSPAAIDPCLSLIFFILGFVRALELV